MEKFRVDENDLSVSNTYLTNSKRRTKMKHHCKENFKRIFVACGRSDLTPTMASKSATVDMPVKWQLNPRKQTEFEHGGFLWNFLRKLR
jgi:hypothetical protein